MLWFLGLTLCIFGSIITFPASWRSKHVRYCFIGFSKFLKLILTWFFFLVFFVLFLVTLSSTVCLYGLLHYRVPCVGVCVCMPFPALCLCVCPVVSQLTERACMCVCLSECVCVCLPEWNVSLISLLLLEGRRGGLYSVISASLWPPLSPWCTWEHTCRSYIEAFKHLSLTLFHYNHKTFRF